MADRFADMLGRQLFGWSGWVFTVGGAIGSFVLGQGYGWIGGLAVLTGLLAVTGHAYAAHRRAAELEAANKELARLLADAEQLRTRSADETLRRIEQILTRAEVVELADQLARHADFVVRMRQFLAALSRRVELRTFVLRDGELFAQAKVPSAATAALQVGDPFVLSREADGIRTDAALLVVNQPPDPPAESVTFRFVSFLSEEGRSLRGLAAASGSVRGLTGYTLRPAVDPDWYAGIESDTIPSAIRRLAEGITREGRGRG